MAATQAILGPFGRLRNLDRRILNLAPSSCLHKPCDITRIL